MTSRSLARVACVAFSVFYAALVLFAFFPHEHRGNVSAATGHCLFCQWSHSSASDLPTLFSIKVFPSVSPFGFFFCDTPTPESFLESLTCRSPPQSA